MPRLHLDLLGGFDCQSSAGQPIRFQARKSRALLAYLALAPLASPRNRLCGLLFDTASNSRGELRWYLSKLRRVAGASRQ